VKLSNDSLLEIRRGNGATDWGVFNETWSEIASLFKHR
jgi:hypothetical protein